MTMKLIYIQCFYDSIKLFKVFYTFTLKKFAQLNNCHHYTWEFQENTLYLAYNREEADSVETRRIRDFISSSVVIPGFLYVESLYWDGWQGHFPWRRGTSQQLPHFHKPAKNWNKCLRYLDFRCTNMGTITIFSMKQSLDYICNVLFRSIQKKEASIDYAVKV